VKAVKLHRGVVMSVSFKPSDDCKKAEVEDKVVLVDDDSM